MPTNVQRVGRWWDDAKYQDSLVALLTQDAKTVVECGHLLEADDFKPGKGAVDGRARWIVADVALQFITSTHRPVADLLEAEVIKYATDTLNFGAGQLGDLHAYMERLRKVKPGPPEAIIKSVREYKEKIFKDAALDEMNALMAEGKLTDAKMHELVKQATRASNGHQEITKISQAGLEARLATRHLRQRVPLTLIAPLDGLANTVSFGEVGLVLAPYKRGKSMFLEWLAVAYARQRLHVLYITLEDAKGIVEDRMYAIATGVPVRDLEARPERTRRRFQRFSNMVRGTVAVYDGTTEGMTVAKIEGQLEECRRQGFFPQALIVDYDERIVPAGQYREKRYASDEVYREFTEVCARRKLIGWLAAQTQRNTRGLKILDGDKVAEDIGKLRKVTCAISLGKGTWTDNSIYLNIAAHKNDVMDRGCEIVPDYTCAMIYDEEATDQARAAAAADTDDDV